DGIRRRNVTGVQTCALPIFKPGAHGSVRQQDIFFHILSYLHVLLSSVIFCVHATLLFYRKNLHTSPDVPVRNWYAGSRSDHNAVIFPSYSRFSRPFILQARPIFLMQRIMERLSSTP